MTELVSRQYIPLFSFRCPPPPLTSASSVLLPHAVFVKKKHRDSQLNYYLSRECGRLCDSEAFLGIFVSHLRQPWAVLSLRATFIF